ncbi:M15 family metallopeptidase [Streptomyces sp. NPDC127105]|uniref:M15 family metallopeptidase n=1 Tax=Streptomyces sp. NPDC127105 TaxID=3345359 RepID=UPI0036605605
MQWQRIVAVGAWHEGCPAGREQLRNVTLTHWGFDGRLHRGVLVVNADVVDSVKRIFARLLADRFPIRQMKPIEEYGGDDNASMSADNSSAYNCRRAGQANAPAADSPHANGRAIDLNPMENPWMDLRCHCWQPSSRYATRTPGTGKITEGDAVWQAFHADGWIWQDIKTPDYQHFDTGYPSRPYTGTLSNS